MGLFDFLKDIGKPAAPSVDLQTSLLEAVKKADLQIRDFNLTLDHGLATLSGLAATQKDLELARLIVGNHKGVEKVNDDALTLALEAAAPSPATPSQVGRMVTVKSGDTLSKIAREYLGNANRYPEIFEANRPMIKDADEIFPGQVLRIPESQITAH